MALFYFLNSGSFYESVNYLYSKLSKSNFHQVFANKVSSLRSKLVLLLGNKSMAEIAGELPSIGNIVLRLEHALVKLFEHGFAHVRDNVTNEPAMIHKIPGTEHTSRLALGHAQGFIDKLLDTRPCGSKTYREKREEKNSYLLSLQNLRGP